MQLRQVARTAVGLSARTLRALPFSALLGYTGHGICDVADLLKPMLFEIEGEMGSRGERSLAPLFDVVLRDMKPMVEISTDDESGSIMLTRCPSSPFAGVDVEAN